MAVQELTPVIGVEPEQDEGQPTTNEFQCSEDVFLTLAGHAHAFGPAAGHIGGNQREQILAAIVGAAVGDQVNLQESDALLVPESMCELAPAI